MYKPTIKDLMAMILVGLGTAVALAFTDFGLSGAALAGIFTMLTVGLEARHSARGCKGSAS